ncbi:MAG: GGDEF domain-containing protein [Solirubrobacterales bacterium]
MSPRERQSSPVNLTTRLLLGVLAVVAAGLVAPLVLGSFTRDRLLLLAAIEMVCLSTIAIGVLTVAGRLDARRRALWVLSRRDELTGVGNYRALQERLSEEIARHTRRGREFSLILLDLDRFKQVNEEFGHLEGDRLLAAIGKALRKEVRGEDSIFRQGGDEFALIAPETNAEEAEEVAARLRERVRISTAGRVPVSASTGIALFPADGRTPDELLRVADSDLLGRKRDGRANDEYRVFRKADGGPGSIDQMRRSGRRS